MTKNKQWIAPFQDRWKQYYKNTNTNQHSGHNIQNINGNNPYMGQDKKW